jgi:thioredoxin reductase (NADPH)
LAAVSPQLVIIGAGPAGVSAALWARSHELDALVIEATREAGGQLHHVHFQPRDLPGIGDVPGPALAARYGTQLGDAGVAVRYGVTAASLASAGEGSNRVVVVSAKGERIEAAAALIVTGARRRRLEVPGEREFEERGVSYSATRDRERLRGRPVAVVGGGDAAYENALILAAAECDVTLVVRGAARARREFRERVAAEPRIHVLQNTRVSAVVGGANVEALMLSGSEGETRLPIEGVVIKVGEIPNTEWCRGAVELDGEGFIVVDARYRASRARVWAAGDVVRPLLPSIAVAIGTAALAAADVRAELESG